MEEKIITGHKNGMLVLLLELVLYIAAVVFLIVGINAGFLPLVVLCVILLLLGWIPLCGLRVLKPQEALVLTLFGKYIGTLKGEGFYFVNPFCSSFNPAAKTKLNQSGDVDGGHKGTDLLAAMQGASAAVEVGGSKKISLKIMTLNNARQKINDCLGNPVEIGIAVMWRVTDTAKAVFNVDNYKEYLSLQCDAALRNIVRVYPYDVAPNVDTTGDGQADEGSHTQSATDAFIEQLDAQERIAEEKRNDSIAEREANETKRQRHGFAGKQATKGRKQTIRERSRRSEEYDRSNEMDF